MAKIQGVCKNIGEACSKALNREVQELEKGMSFVCEECEKPLMEVENKKGSRKNKGKVVAIALSAAAVLGVVGGYYALSGKEEALVSTTIVLPKKIESITIVEPSIELFKGDSKTITVEVIPSDANKDGLEWLVTDANVATVSNGKVSAIAEGETKLTIKDVTGGATATCNVTVKKEEIPEENGSGQSVSTGQLAYGKWTGGTRNGKPHGTQITFTFTRQHQIDSRDPKKRVAEVGDYVIGEYVNGSLVQGRWYKKSGGFESVLIGKSVGN